jgi:hypothetical protein
VANFGIASTVWHTSTRSGGGNCVEVAVHEGSVLVRDSVDADGVVLRVSPATWSAFLKRTHGETRSAKNLEAHSRADRYRCCVKHGGTPNRFSFGVAYQRSQL